MNPSRWLVYRSIMPKAEILSKRMDSWPRNKALMTTEILRTIFQPRALSFDTPASRERVCLFYYPPSNFSWRTHVDRSCIFCGFFRVSWYSKTNYRPIAVLVAFNNVDHSLLDFKSAVQYMKHFIYHFTVIPHGLIRTHK